MSWNSTSVVPSATTLETSISLHSILEQINRDENVTQNIKSNLLEGIIPYIYTINLSIVCTTFCLFGIVANIINVVVFWRLDFSETINIAFMGLSVSDFFAVLSLLWVTICYIPFFMYSDVPILLLEVQHKTVGWTHIIFTRVSAFLTVYITLERCLCISFPLKIRRLLNPKRVATIIVLIYVIIIGSSSQNFATFRLERRYVPSRNMTMIGVTYKKNRHVIETATYYVTAFMPVFCLVAVVICSCILIAKLNQRSKWLKSATSTSEDSHASTKDRQIVRLIVAVAIIFVCTYTPSVLQFLGMSIEPELKMGKRYENLFIVIYSITNNLQALNSSVNIIVYYNMSSKYKKQFWSLFSFSEEK